MTNLKFIIYFCLLFILVGKLVAEDFGDKAEKRSPLFVSLGCSCEVVTQFKLAGVRSRAFPFDWLLTTDFCGFVASIQDDFAFFLDKRYLMINENIFNTYYNIEFRHDLYSMDTDFDTYLPKIQEKYQRRIERFRQLENYPGKVYFVRSAFPPGYDHSYPTITSECVTITPSHAEDLKNVLCQKFPHLDFTLIIINYAAVPSPHIEGIDKVIEFKVGEAFSYQQAIQVLKESTLISH